MVTGGDDGNATTLGQHHAPRIAPHFTDSNPESRHIFDVM